MSGEILGLFIVIGVLILAMAAFCIGIFYYSQKKNKWMAFTAVGFVILAAASVFIISVFNINLSPPVATWLLVTERFFLGISLFFFLAYQFGKEDSY